MGLGARSSASDTSSTTTTRLKREDFRRTKHDSAFSQWKILIGAFDWEDYSMGKEGVERYRTENLPNWTSCPGVYELGIATSRPQSGRETRKLDSSSVIPVYLGQADNLRNRLQQYGRDGAHLENGYTSSKTVSCQSISSHKGPGLFTDIFSRGLPIVYRCAPIKSKNDAEITEKQLLDKFDYAWNKGSNVSRRQDDIHKKLERLEKTSKFSLLAKEFLFSNKREVGIKIRNGSNMNGTGNSTIFSRIHGVRRLQETPMHSGYGDCGDNICGVATGHGSVCTSPPVAGRKRCAVHKGLRVNGYNSKLATEGKLPLAANPKSGVETYQEYSDNQDQKQRYITENHHPCEQTSGKNFNLTCGIILEDGSPCKRSPVRGNKRCLEHKGRRIRRSNLSFQTKNYENIA
ncbi:protein EFFECTOR OF TRANSCRIPTION 2-like [Salvia miltiorrhiza]|uniref:protein EFFECTOR OF TRANSCRIPTION 2-like n=1 Tax=Salvia miltiorrhiza TaxID=226208 RepID=UPI0025AC8BB3|nr:protein EFFECTOR OF TRANSCRIPTION 2-like [Salvia miltiorrhiza]